MQLKGRRGPRQLQGGGQGGGFGGQRWGLLAGLVLPLMLRVPTARAWTLELKGAQDLTFAAGAEFRSAPLASSGGAGALIRSGSPGDHSSATCVKPSPEAVKRVQLDYDYVIGYESHGGEAPVLSVWVHDTPAPDGPGAKQICARHTLGCPSRQS